MVFDGPRGVGKGTIVSEIIKLHPDKFKKIVSFCTRSPRIGEIDGVNYHFVTKKQFEDKIKSGDIFEYTHYGDTYRGMAKSSVHEIIDADKIAIHDLDVIGLRALREHFPNQVVGFFVTADKNIIRERLSLLTDSDIDERLANFEKRHEHIKEYDFIINNNESSYSSAKKVLHILAEQL